MTGTTEFSLIEKYFTHDFARADVVLGVGDDCALLTSPHNKQLAVTVDTLVAGVHFPVETTAEDIAYKALAVNLSDLAAMGAEPAWATLALTLPVVSEDWLEKFAASFKTTLHDYGVQLIGGDTTQGPLSITVQLTGFVDSDRVMRRDAAKPGDRIYVTGYLGDAAMGLQLLQTHASLVSAGGNACIEKLNRPQPRVQFARQAVAHCACGIDISDGLLADLGHILKASACGGRIYLDRLPVSEAFNRAATAFDQAERRRMLLAGGDDYELCLVTAVEHEAALFALAASLALPLTHIGDIDASAELTVLGSQGEAITLNHAGYEHFAHE